MAVRLCDRCGGKMTPRWPRVRVNDEMWCPSCVKNTSHVQTTAAGWSHEDIVRHEIGRQKVHTVNGTHELCPSHLSLHRNQRDFANGVAEDVGLGHRVAPPSISPPHEGKCVECAEQYGSEARTLPWNRPPGNGHRVTPVHEERQPHPHIDTDELLQQGRWPYRQQRSFERFTQPQTGIQSLNARNDMDRHPDLDWKIQTFGVANTSLGRAGYARHRTAAVTDHPFHDPEGWKQTPAGILHPVRHAIEGARAFASSKGLGDPHAHDFSQVLQTKDRVGEIGRHYDRMPEFDKSAMPHFHAMRDEVNQQHDFATKRMGIKFESVDHDPYKDVHEMVHDVHNNKRLKVMSTKVTGSHPVFTDHENDKFRFVHDLFGHAATGRGFDRHGEEAAFQAHSLMFSHHARPAMAAETRGQNSSLILNGDFSPQKIGVLPEHMHSDHSIDFHKRSATLRRAVVIRPGRPDRLRTFASIRVQAHDSGDGETIFHCPFCGSGQVIARADGTVECEFCTTAFTVQVQPQMPAFPQTINGVPVDVPGMPAGGAGANVPAGDPGMDPMGADGPPGADGDPSEEAGDDTEDGGDDKPAFLKGSSLRSDRGDELTLDQYARRLALTHLDRPQVLAKIKQKRSA